MRIYLVRHGIAVDRGTAGVAEEDRPLTKEGIRKMRVLASGLNNLSVAPAALLSSPLPRAHQTAAILLERLGGEIALEVLEALAPSGRRSDVYRAIRQRADRESLMLVGHQPSLGQIAGEIAFGSPAHDLDLKKGGVCALDVEALDPRPRGTLLWLLTPAILSRIG